MRIVLAQIKKDIQSQRAPLTLWAICLALGVLLVTIVSLTSHLGKGILFHGHQLSDSQAIAGVISYAIVVAGISFGLMLGMFLLLPFLVIRIVQDDPLISTTAFWRTRPIPRDKLLLAKALLIALVLLPLLSSVSWGGAKIGEGHFAPAELAWIMSLAALASITPGLGSLLGYGLALVFGKLIFSGIINYLWRGYHGPDLIISQWAADSVSSVSGLVLLNREDFFSLCYFTGFAAVFVHQYLTLCTRRSLYLFIAVLGLIALLQMLAGGAGDSGSHWHIQTQP